MYRKKSWQEIDPEVLLLFEFKSASYFSTSLSLIILKINIYFKTGKKTYINIYKAYLDTLKPFTMIVILFIHPLSIQVFF